MSPALSFASLPSMLLMAIVTHAMAPPTTDGQTTDSVRVMSFNVRFGTAPDGDNSWPERRQLVAETIRAFAPDLLGTQETLPIQADYLKEQLPDYRYVGWSRDASPDGEQCGIFIRSARFEVLESGQFWLSEIPEERASKSWDSSLPRVATWVRLKDRSSGRQTLMINTHFDHIGATARLESARLIARRLDKLREDQPVVITGDFNCGVNSAPYRALVSETPLRDSYRVANVPSEASELPAEDPSSEIETGTFNGFRGEVSGARIDWILVGPEWTIEAASIDRTESQGRYPSDHFPVTAVLRLP